MNSPLYLALGVEEVLQTALLDTGMGDTEAQMVWEFWRQANLGSIGTCYYLVWTSD